MPELPEVETIVRALNTGGREGPPVVGRVIARGQVLWARTLADTSPSEFLERLHGLSIKRVYRRGKFICFDLQTLTLLIHLRMSGDLRVLPQMGPNGLPGAYDTHDRLALDFTDGLRLVFNDPRKFGRAWLTADSNAILANLGPEPLDDGFTSEEFFARLSKCRRQLKPLLMDQSFLAGLGNIYTDEALYVARLHPLQLSNQLDLQTAGQLLEAIRSVLKEGIRRNGASIDWVYRGGSFQDQFKVYGRTGDACPNCGTPIERIVVGQRGTHFCPSCQKVSISTK